MISEEVWLADSSHIHPSAGFIELNRFHETNNKLIQRENWKEEDDEGKTKPNKKNLHDWLVTLGIFVKEE